MQIIPKETLLIISRSPTYNLSAVLKETGLKADVLRAWERRYQLPQPQRTTGGHRLYSAYDIETVKWLRARQAEGLSIRRAVEMWQGIIAAGNDPLTEYPPTERSTSGFTTTTAQLMDQLCERWLEACCAFDGRAADDILNHAFGLYPAETVCEVILQKGLNKMGENWHNEKVSIQQEHFASELAMRRIETLISTTPLPSRAQTIVIGCPSGEWHTFPMLLLSLLLRRKGFRVIDLGANLPLEQMAETIATIRPNLIVLAAQQITTAAALHAAAFLFLKQGFVLAYGGLIFNRVPGLCERIPAHFLGENIHDAVQRIEHLVVNPIPLPTAGTLEENEPDLARQYKEKRAFIELAVWEKLQKYHLQLEYVNNANLFLGDGLNAALQLGNIAFLETDLGWLSERQTQTNAFVPYLQAYHQVLRRELGTAGAAITDWIDAYIRRI